MDDHAIIEQAVERLKSESDSELLRRSGALGRAHHEVQQEHDQCVAFYTHNASAGFRAHRQSKEEGPPAQAERCHAAGPGSLLCLKQFADSTP